MFSAAQDLKNLFKFHAYLLDNLLTLCDVCFRIVAGQALTRAADGEAVVVQQASNLANDQDILALVIAAIATSFNWL